MAQEWYLMRSPYDQVSGFEDEALDDFAQEGFLEALSTSIADEVELINYDLTVITKLRVIMEGKLQDTKLKSLVRQMLAPIGSCKAGDYIKYKGRYWIITGLVDDNGMYEKAVLYLCNYLLTWINTEGQITQRWVNVASASQYNNGETSTQNYFTRTDQLLVIMPPDDESKLLTTGHRFIIDDRTRIYQKKFGDDVVCETTYPVNVYKITRSDSVLFDYEDCGHHQFMCYQDEQQDTDGYYVIGGKGYWLCDVPQKDKEEIDVVFKSQIICDTQPIIELGGVPTTFTARFENYKGEDTEVEPIWNITCDFMNKLTVVQNGNSISISAIDKTKKIINKSFELSLSAENYEPTTLTITIKPF